MSRRYFDCPACAEIGSASLVATDPETGDDLVKCYECGHVFDPLDEPDFDTPEPQPAPHTIPGDFIPGLGTTRRLL